MFVQVSVCKYASLFQLIYFKTENFLPEVLDHILTTFGCVDLFRTAFMLYKIAIFTQVLKEVEIMKISTYLQVSCQLPSTFGNDRTDIVSAAFYQCDTGAPPHTCTLSYFVRYV